VASQINSICAWSFKVSCGNTYLRDYALQFTQQAIVNPTTIDTIHLHNQVRNQHASDRLVVGWTGTHSTLKYLEQLVPVISELEKKYAFEFRIISNQPPILPLQSLVFHPWNKVTEISDLVGLHIGLMPLEDDPWAKGKCAFKALQYMALGIPAIASPVGMNREVIQDGVNGYVCATPEEWRKALEALLENAELRIRLGEAARVSVIERYSVMANKENFLNLFCS
jgi:glycosyltransferase involved in cell wall biosynthesis